MENKFVRVLLYIILFIILSPVIAVCLYIALGGSLFIALYIYGFKKHKNKDSIDGKSYRYMSSALFVIGLLIVFLIGKVNPLSWIGYLWIQVVAFIGFLPLCYYQYKRINNKEV